MANPAVDISDTLASPRTGLGSDAAPPPLRCILMDDSEFDRRSILCVASKSRFATEFTETRSIEETRRALKDHSPDIVLVDYRVPDGDGIAFAREIASDLGASGPAVIVVTGDSTDMAAIQALRAGAADFLRKDQITPDLFDGAIENAMRASARAASPALSAERAEAELTALRAQVHENMRRLKQEVIPLLALAWKTSGDDASRSPEAAVRADMGRKVREVPALIDDTVIAALVGTASASEELVDLAVVVTDVAGETRGSETADAPLIEVGQLPAVIADPGRLRLLVTLLMLDAAHSAPVGQRAEIKVAAGSDKQGNVVLSVRDNGLGLSARRQKLGREVASGRTQATGKVDPYSWSLCQRLAEQMGGAFRVSDAAGEGVSAMVRLPSA